VQTETFRSVAQRLHQPVVFLNRADFTERAIQDARYKGGLIKLLGMKAD
jgi:hypothetical protein